MINAPHESVGEAQPNGWMNAVFEMDESLQEIFKSYKRKSSSVGS